MSERSLWVRLENAWSRVAHSTRVRHAHQLDQRIASRNQPTRPLAVTVVTIEQRADHLETTL